MNVEIGNEAAQFHFEEYLIKFSGQCICNAASSREKIFGHVSWRRRHTAIQLIGKWKTQEILWDTPHCTENMKHIFPEIKLCSLVPNVYIPVSVSDWYILTIGPPILRKLGTRSHSFISGNISFKFSGQCICNAAYSREPATQIYKYTAYWLNGKFRKPW